MPIFHYKKTKNTGFDEMGFAVPYRGAKAAKCGLYDFGIATWSGNSLTSTGQYALALTAQEGAVLDETEKAFYLPGNDYAGFMVTLPSEIDLSGEFCIDFEAKVTGSNNHMGFFRLGGWGSQVCSIHTNSGILWGQPGSFSCVKTTPTGTWNHYLWQRDASGKIQVYLDEALCAEYQYSSIVDYTGAELSLNAQYAGFGTPFQGYIRNFRISDTALY